MSPYSLELCVVPLVVPLTRGAICSRAGHPELSFIVVQVCRAHPHAGPHCSRSVWYMFSWLWGLTFTFWTRPPALQW